MLNNVFNQLVNYRVLTVSLLYPPPPANYDGEGPAA